VVLARPWSEALALLAGVCAWPALASAGAPPDSAALPAMQAKCDAAPQVRVTTTRAVFVAHRLTLDAGGLMIPLPKEPPALITIDHGGMTPQRYAWSEIERLQSQRSRTLKYTLAGALTGAALGATSVAVNGPDMFEKGDNGGVAFAWLLTLGFAGIGMLIGMVNPALQPIYP
jgi:hypothetical protein